MARHDARVRLFFFVVVAACAAAFPLTAGAQDFVKCPQVGEKLLKVPEITRDAATNKLQAVLRVSDQDRLLWFTNPTTVVGGPVLTPYCAPQHLRFFEGYSPIHADEKWPSSGNPAEPLPGPTLRARVGDIVQITFLNQVNLANFPDSQYFDRAENGLGTGCDEVAGGQIYPTGGGIKDTFPNCFHGSSTANLHFHGTHATPSSTGDNVLLQLRPTPRKDGQPVVTEASVKPVFDTFYEQCQSQLTHHAPNSWPTKWTNLPALYREQQQLLLEEYDKALQPAQKLWPPNQAAIDEGEWPQYFIGAYPYCFQLPEYKNAPKNTQEGLQMGQAPGTQWYHMHKHGSTALNVANSLLGAFIIEGQYDDQLKVAYVSSGTRKNWGLVEKVLVVQQLGGTPNLMRTPKNLQVQPLSINGRRQPVIEMRPGQVQLWRIVNGSGRSGLYFPSQTGFQWVQIAQDGVQFHLANYRPPKDKNAGAPFMMAAGNRADLLVRIPKDLAPGDYPVQFVDVVKPTELPGGTKPNVVQTLLTARVSARDAAKDPHPEMPFLDATNFPTFPEFLGDINANTVVLKRELTFNSTTRAAGNDHTINGHKFGDFIDQAMLLNTAEEWKVINTTSDAIVEGAIMHPFHIHINPFQIFETFDPWDVRYVFVKSQEVEGKNCFIDPLKPETWKPCDLTKLSPPFVWFDVAAIPGGKQVDDTTGTGTKVVIPGYFKMRSRFADYPGQYVMHCHILAHEDRGMMQLVEVVTNKSVLAHH
jgi:FtsP/CotA-like multicopper oxidase with cupredoxin domain